MGPTSAAHGVRTVCAVLGGGDLELESHHVAVYRTIPGTVPYCTYYMLMCYRHTHY